jgi:DNA-binding NtrC family response regulator
MSVILVIDDDVPLRRVIQRALEQAGHTVVAPESSAEAARLIEAGDFDLMLTDIVMPEIEGLELIRRLRKAHRDRKVIAMSGGGQGSSAQYLDIATRFGAAEVLNKPFRLVDMVGAVDRVLGKTA